MKLKKMLPTILGVIGAVSLTGAILLFAIALPQANAPYKKVLTSLIASFMLILTALVAYYLYITRDAEPNFFLFDRAKKRNIAVEELTFQIVNERMGFFLTLVCETPNQLWQNDVLENDRKLGYRRVYRPLLAYKMLYDLADKDVPAYWELLYNATPETVNSLCEALEQGGEKEMVKAFRFIMETYRARPDRIKDFVCGNTRYIRGRMLTYVRRNIEIFY